MALTEAPRPRRARFVHALMVATVALPAATAAFVGATNAWVAWAARGHAYTELGAVPARRVAIVPGSPVERGRPLGILRARLEAALTLYRMNRVRAILVSGQETPTAPESTVMAVWLKDHGVPPAAIMTDDRGTRTRETMNRAAGLYDVNDAVICTQDVNMSRSLFLAQRAGIDSVGVTLPSKYSVRYRARETLKTTLAAIESLFRPGPDALARELVARAAIAER